MYTGSSADRKTVSLYLHVQRYVCGQNQPFIAVLHLSVWNMMPTLESSCGHPSH